MYSKIVNPKTGRKVSIKSKLGKSILLSYINYSLGGTSIADGKSKKRFILMKLLKNGTKNAIN